MCLLLTVKLTSLLCQMEAQERSPSEATERQTNQARSFQCSFFSGGIFCLTVAGLFVIAILVDIRFLYIFTGLVIALVITIVVCVLVKRCKHDITRTSQSVEPVVIYTPNLQVAAQVQDLEKLVKTLTQDLQRLVQGLASDNMVARRIQTVIVELLDISRTIREWIMGHIQYSPSDFQAMSDFVATWRAIHQQLRSEISENTENTGANTPEDAAAVIVLRPPKYTEDDREGPPKYEQATNELPPAYTVEETPDKVLKAV